MGRGRCSATPRKPSVSSAVPASGFPCGRAPSGLTWSEREARSRASAHAAAEPPCCTQPRLPTEARPCLSRRFPLGVSATASATSGAVYTVGPRTPPPPPLPPSLHPSAVADSAAATSSAAASSLWSIFQPPNPEKQRLQPRRQETPPQVLGGRGGQSTGGFSAIEQQPLSSFCNPLPAPRSSPPPGRPRPHPRPIRTPLGLLLSSVCREGRQSPLYRPLRLPL